MCNDKKLNRYRIEDLKALSKDELQSLSFREFQKGNGIESKYAYSLDDEFVKKCLKEDLVESNHKSNLLTVSAVLLLLVGITASLFVGVSVLVASIIIFSYMLFMTHRLDEKKVFTAVVSGEGIYALALESKALCVYDISDAKPCES